jgi:hypothetical protein
LIWALEKLKHESEAILAYKKFIAASDSLKIIENREKLETTLVSSELTQRQKEITLLKENEKILVAKNEAEAKSKLLFQILLGLTVIIAIYFSYLIKKGVLKYLKERKLRISEKAEAEGIIQDKTQELSSMALQMMNKNEAIKTLNESVSQVKSKFKIGESADDEKFNSQLNSLNRQLKELSKMDEDWDKFKTHFNQIYTGFFDKIHKKHPNLTQNDLKTCAYLHLKLDTNQMAQLLNVSNAAIQKQRHRLRKKMKLPARTDIGKYIEDLLLKFDY